MDTLNRMKGELEVLKSWGIETIPIDKILDMIGENDHHTEDTVFYPSETEKDGVDKYFRYIPMYIGSDRSYPLYNEMYGTTGFGIPKPNVWIY